MWHKVLGGILLIVGIAIGAGMLVLPIFTGAFGFQSAIVLFLFCWAIMTFSAYLMLEVSLWMPPNTNLTSMLRKTLSFPVQVFAWFTYLILLYAIMTVYFEGLGSLAGDFLRNGLHLHIDTWLIVFVAALLIGFFIQSGAKVVEPINRFLILFMLIIFTVFAVMLSPHVQPHFLQSSFHWHIWCALPIAIAAFSFHFIIPSLRDYLGGNVKALRVTILIGSLIPLIVYVIWEAIILGVIPAQGEFGLSVLLMHKASTAVLAHVLTHQVNSAGFSIGFRLFSFFAIATSTLGIGLSMFDFVSDAIGLHEGVLTKILLLLIAFLPPFIFATEFSGKFAVLLEYSGMFSALLFVLIPVLMVWRGRYYTYMPSQYRVFGGKLMLLIPFLTAFAVVFFQLFYGQ